MWLDLFYRCHEWRLSGAQVKGRLKPMINLGYYSRKEWPGPGTVLEQTQLIVEIFRVIRDEESRMQAETVA